MTPETPLPNDTESLPIVLEKPKPWITRLEALIPSRAVDDVTTGVTVAT